MPRQSDDIQTGSIVLQSVGKRFVVRKERRPALQDTILDRLRFHGMRGPVEGFWALSDVNLQIRPGESFGIIGPNGCGKSTLLKLMAQTISPTTGLVKVRGRVAALLELGAGFHPELTGRENVFLNGSLMGLSRTLLRQRFDEIVEFAGVRKFLDVPIKHYSSGMTMRLAFAVAINIDADILLIDEVLAVGDVAFQEKCITSLKQLQSSGRTIVMVSHGMGSVCDLCGRAAWIRNGSMQSVGSPQEIVDDYLATFTTEGSEPTRQSKIATA